MKLAVVTHVPVGEKSPWYGDCVRSVHRWLPDDAMHIVIECESLEKLEQARWETLKLAPYVCFVDHDDIVLNDSFRRCMTALDATGLGVAFTNEAYIDRDGASVPSSDINPPDRIVDYLHIANSPQTVHHLAMINTAKVDWHAKTISDKLGAGCEWMIKGGTAMKSGAVHVPINGYAWRQHSEQASASTPWLTRYSSAIPGMSSYMHILVSGRRAVLRFD